MIANIMLYFHWHCVCSECSSMMRLSCNAHTRRVTSWRDSLVMGLNSHFGSVNISFRNIRQMHNVRRGSAAPSSLAAVLPAVWRAVLTTSAVITDPSAGCPSASHSVQLLETELSAAAQLWNSLPPDTVACDTLSWFRQELKTFLFRRFYPSILPLLFLLWFLCFFT